MTTLIVCVSVHHGNTRQVAEAIGEVLGGIGETIGESPNR